MNTSAEMQSRVFVTGATGFVGRHVIRELRTRGYAVSALVNHADLQWKDEGIRIVKGDLFSQTALMSAMRDCTAAIHLVGIIAENRSKRATFHRIHVEGTKSVVDAVKLSGITRYIHMSALGTRANAASNYHRTKFDAEQYVIHSGLDYTIIRPSLIHGPDGEFMRMETNWARKKAPPFFAMPYFGAGLLGRGGAGMLQPVFVDDVAKAFVDSLDDTATIKQIYPLGGSEKVTWPQMHEIIANAVTGHRRWVFPFPVPIAKFYAAIGLGKLLGFNKDQVIMSQEDNICELTKFKTDFGWTPKSFSESLGSYAEQLR